MKFKPCPKCGNHADEVGHNLSFSSNGAWYTCRYWQCKEVTPLNDIALSKAEESCHSLAGVIGEAIPDGKGYMLMLFDFGDDGEVAYMSNANREDMVKILRQHADYLENNGKG